MVMQRLFLTALMFAAATASASAVQTTLTIQLGEDQSTDFDRKVVPYSCATGEPFSVEYINAPPNFIALIPIEGVELIFASVESATGTGAKYVSGRWVWWSKDGEARLLDLTKGDKAEPVNTCTEVNQTP